MTPRASVVVVAHGRADVTERCLEALDRAVAAAPDGTFELVLVDNASPDDGATLALLESWSDRARVVALAENRNFAGGCNAGAEIARGDALVFLNNDCYAERGALETLVDTALEPGVGAVGARLVYPDGTLQHAGVVMFRVPGGLVVPHHVFHHEAGDLPAARGTYDLDCVTGACLVIPRALFSALGGFDCGYVNGWEDVDLCLRVRSAGRRVVYRGDVVLVHEERQTRGDRPDVDGNAARFYARWGALLAPDDELLAELWDAVPGGPDAAAVADASSRFASVVVVGQPSGVGPAAAQARAVIAALEAGGVPAAARNRAAVLASPRLPEEEWAPTLRALARAVSPDARVIDPATLPPVVEVAECGPGGEGTLVVAPGHDLEACRRALALARARDAARPLQVLPTAATAELAELVARLAPDAELLAPCASEHRLAALSARADTVVSIDPADRNDRAALVAAGAGAAVVVRPDGPGALVLGTLATGDDRGARRARVFECCAGERALAALMPAPAPVV